MKTVFKLLILLFFVSCSSKDDLAKNQPDVTYQEEPVTSFVFDIDSLSKPDVTHQEEQITFFVFDIDSFGFLEEFPISILEIKAMFPDENFEEGTFESNGRGVPLGDYAYTLNSDNIHFTFWGDTVEDAILQVVEIFDPQYQCKTMQVIGMSAKELESLSGMKLNRDRRLLIFTELYSLTIETKNGIVHSYSIVAQL